MIRKWKLVAAVATAGVVATGVFAVSPSASAATYELPEDEPCPPAVGSWVFKVDGNGFVTDRTQGASILLRDGIVCEYLAPKHILGAAGELVLLNDTVRIQRGIVYPQTVR